MTFEEWKEWVLNMDGLTDGTLIPEDYRDEPEVRLAIENPEIRYSSRGAVFPDGVWLFNDGQIAKIETV